MPTFTIQSMFNRSNQAPPYFSFSSFPRKHHGTEVKWVAMHFLVDFEELQIVVIKLLMWHVNKRALDYHY